MKRENYSISDNRRNAAVRALVAGLLILILLPLFPVQGKAAEETETIVSFSAPGMWIMSWSFPYSDSYFDQPSDRFSRDLAKASCGLFLSAFREKSQDALVNQYDIYLGGSGFSKIYAFGYDKPTAVDTLSGVIASKEIGDYTLIAASACGQGYQKEWGGNLQVGDGERHEGFDNGAKILEREILDYLEREQITGKVKLWIAGFSRASAVGNLAAADLIRSGRFEDVYAYLFACPNTTKKPEKLSGIYNICGVFDPVPMTPLQSWGFGRYGTTLYTPAAETDANYDTLVSKANEVCEQISGDFFRYNPELNYQLHLILEFVGEVFPDSKEYLEKLQPEIMGIWTEANPDQIFQILQQVFVSLDDLNQRQQYATGEFLNYLNYISSLLLEDRRNSIALRNIMWADDQSLAANLMREHSPYFYLCWIFSSLSDEELFGGPGITRRVSIIGDVDVEVWSGGRFVTARNRSGDIYLPDDLSILEENTVIITRNGEQTVVFLPANKDFEVRVLTPSLTQFSFFDADYSAGILYGDDASIRLVSASEGTYKLDYPAWESEGKLSAISGNIISDALSEIGYSPTTVMQIEVDSVNVIGPRGVILIVIGTALFIGLVLIICLIIAIVHRIRKKSHGGFSPLFIILPHLLILAVLIELTALLTDRLYMVTMARMAAAGSSMLVLFLLSLRGLIRNRNLPNLFITFAIFVLSFVNVFLYQKSKVVGASRTHIIIYCVVMAFLATAASMTFLIGRKKSTVIGRLAETYPQLYLDPDTDSAETYREVVLKGESPEKTSLSAYHASRRDTNEAVDTPAGRVPVITIRNRSDFERLLRNFMAAKEGPRVQIPESQGSALIRVFNWKKINAHKKKFLSEAKKAGEASPDWDAEFARFRENSENYTDELILLSLGPYSALPAEKAGFKKKQWLRISYKIRRYHELTHFICRRKYPEQVNAVWDELAADAVGIYAALKRYDAVLAGKLLGIENGRYAGGRLENYTEDPEVLCEKVSSALTGIETIIKENKGMKAFAMIDVLEEQQSSLGF